MSARVISQDKPTERNKPVTSIKKRVKKTIVLAIVGTGMLALIAAFILSNSIQQESTRALVADIQGNKITVAEFEEIYALVNEKEKMPPALFLNDVVIPTYILSILAEKQGIEIQFITKGGASLLAGDRFNARRQQAKIFIEKIGLDKTLKENRTIEEVKEAERRIRRYVEEKGKKMNIRVYFENIPVS